MNLKQGDLCSGEEHYNEYLIGQIASGFSGDSVRFRAMETNLQACFALVRLIKGVNLEIRDAVSFLQRDLKDLQGADERRQPGQALLPAAAHPDQQSVSPRRLQDPIDTAAEAGETRVRRVKEIKSCGGRIKRHPAE